MNRRNVVLGSGAVIAGGLRAAPALGDGLGSYASIVRDVWAPIDPAGGLREIVRAATLAANSHNTQPWQFIPGQRDLTIAPDRERRLPAVDPDDHHLYVSLGCATENAVQAASALGLTVTPVYSPDQDQILLPFESAPAVGSELLSAIVQRQCTRAEYDGRQVIAEDLGRLVAAATMPGVECMIITDPVRMKAIADYVAEGNTWQMRDEVFMKELTTWLRFNEGQAIETRDGLFSGSSGNALLPSWIARPLLPFVFREKSENAKYVKHIRSSSGIAVFCSAKNDTAHWISAGRACQRFALEATVLGLKNAFINQPVEVPSVRSQLSSFLGLGERRPDLVVRFGYGPSLPRSLRRPVESVIAAKAAH